MGKEIINTIEKPAAVILTELTEKLNKIKISYKDDRAYPYFSFSLNQINCLIKIIEFSKDFTEQEEEISDQNLTLLIKELKLAIEPFYSVAKVFCEILKKDGLGLAETAFKSKSCEKSGTKEQFITSYKNAWKSKVDESSFNSQLIIPNGSSWDFKQLMKDSIDALDLEQFVSQGATPWRGLSWGITPAKVSEALSKIIEGKLQQNDSGYVYEFSIGHPMAFDAAVELIAVFEQYPKLIESIVGDNLELIRWIDIPLLIQDKVSFQKKLKQHILGQAGRYLHQCPDSRMASISKLIKASVESEQGWFKEKQKQLNDITFQLEFKSTDLASVTANLDQLNQALKIIDELKQRKALHTTPKQLMAAHNLGDQDELLEQPMPEIILVKNEAQDYEIFPVKLSLEKLIEQIADSENVLLDKQKELQAAHAQLKQEQYNSHKQKTQELAKVVNDTKLKLLSIQAKVGMIDNGQLRKELDEVLQLLKVIQVNHKQQRDKLDSECRIYDRHQLDELTSLYHSVEQAIADNKIYYEELLSLLSKRQEDIGAELKTQNLMEMGQKESFEDALKMQQARLQRNEDSLTLLKKELEDAEKGQRQVTLDIATKDNNRLEIEKQHCQENISLLNHKINEIYFAIFKERAAPTKEENNEKLKELDEVIPTDEKIIAEEIKELNKVIPTNGLNKPDQIKPEIVKAKKLNLLTQEAEKIKSKLDFLNRVQSLNGEGTSNGSIPFPAIEKEKEINAGWAGYYATYSSFNRLMGYLDISPDHKDYNKWFDFRKSKQQDPKLISQFKELVNEKVVQAQKLDEKLNSAQAYVAQKDELKGFEDKLIQQLEALELKDQALKYHQHTIKHLEAQQESLASKIKFKQQQAVALQQNNLTLTASIESIQAILNLFSQNEQLAESIATMTAETYPDVYEAYCNLSTLLKGQQEAAQQYRSALSAVEKTINNNLAVLKSKAEQYCKEDVQLLEIKLQNIRDNIQLIQSNLPVFTAQNSLQELSNAIPILNDAVKNYLKIHSKLTQTQPLLDKIKQRFKLLAIISSNEEVKGKLDVARNQLGNSITTLLQELNNRLDQQTLLAGQIGRSSESYTKHHSNIQAVESFIAQFPKLDDLKKSLAELKESTEICTNIENRVSNLKIQLKNKKDELNQASAYNLARVALVSKYIGVKAEAQATLEEDDEGVASKDGKLVRYKRSRPGWMKIKDKVFKKDYQERMKFYQDIEQELQQYQTSGDSSALRLLIASQRDRFPGRRFQPVLSSLVYDLIIHDQGIEQREMEVVPIESLLEGDIKVHIQNLYKQIDEMSKYGKKIKNEKAGQKIQKLAGLLTTCLDQFISENKNNLINRSALGIREIADFHEKFYNLLHSKDDKFLYQKNWKVIVGNIAIAATVFGVIAAGIKLVHSKFFSQGHASFFFDKTGYSKSVGLIDKNLARLSNHTGTFGGYRVVGEEAPQQQEHKAQI